MQYGRNVQICNAKKLWVDFFWFIVFLRLILFTYILQTRFSNKCNHISSVRIVFAPANRRTPSVGADDLPDLIWGTNIFEVYRETFQHTNTFLINKCFRCNGIIFINKWKFPLMSKKVYIIKWLFIDMFVQSIWHWFVSYIASIISLHDPAYTWTYHLQANGTLYPKLTTNSSVMQSFKYCIILLIANSLLRIK